MSDLAAIRTFPQLVKYLRDELDWPITSDDFEDLTFDYTPQELGIDSKSAAKIQEIKRLRSLSVNQPWGVFFVKFEPKRLPIVALRRILSSVAIKRRASANSAERKAWEAEDLLFISNYGGEGDGRQITFAHFSQDPRKRDLPTLKVLGWDNLDTPLHIDHVADTLHEHLRWPRDEANIQMWRAEWRQAFGLGYREVVTTSRTLAIRLAGLARAIRNRISAALEIETEDGPLTTLMRAFREALVHDLDAEGFADMYAQTIAYGLLSARITNPKADTADDLAAQIPVTNPFLKALMETFLRAGGRRADLGGGPSLDFDELGVSEVVELLDRAHMDAVIRDFGDRNPQEDPVIHFYELFLKEYDAKKRMQRGVFYTPRPVVSYIVRSVHELLQTEFGLADGLADTATWGDMVNAIPGLSIPEGVKATDRFVTVLDPATGTGTFLVEAIEVIHRTLVEKWKRESQGEKAIGDLWNEYVAQHLLPRLHGYELLMAPYAIAHLKIGLKLHETGYRFGSHERARIFLTNALEPAHDFSGTLAFAIPALAHEASQVNDVKRHQQFTVVIGNPPYSISSLNTGKWIVGITAQYKDAVRHERNIQPLSDDYVKFVGLGQHLVSQSGAGIVALITNHTFLSGLIHRGMRSILLRAFDTVYVLDLHGSALVGLGTPDGLRDQNVFDIQQGVAVTIGLVVRALERNRRHGQVRHGDLWGTRSEKYSRLDQFTASQLSLVNLPSDEPNCFFVPTQARDETYESWPSIQSVFTVHSTGLETGRDEVLIKFDRSSIVEVARDLVSQSSGDDIAARLGLRDTSGWPVSRRRERVRARGLDRVLDDVRTVSYRPFDKRFTLYCDFLRRAQYENMRHMLSPNLGLIASRIIKGEVPAHSFVSREPIEKILISPKTSNNAFLFPLYLQTDANGQAEIITEDEGRKPNLDTDFLRSLTIALEGGTADSQSVMEHLSPEEIFYYIYAVLHSPGYRSRYASFLKVDFPRLPLPSSLELLGQLSQSGKELTALHLVEAPVQEALTARFDKSATEWRYDFAQGQRPPVSLSFHGPLKPAVGKVDWSDDTVWLDATKPKRGTGDGGRSGTVGFRGVPEAVWNFHVGGYQVCAKWLKDRKGRVLTADDIAHYCKIVIALRETIRIMGEIDDVIAAHGGWPGAFQVVGAL